MKFWDSYLFMVALGGVWRLSEGREGRVIFLNTDNSIDIGKWTGGSLVVVR
jgi:hypothetical protein